MNAPASTAVGQRTTLFHRRPARRQRGKALSYFVPAVLLVLSALGVVSGKKSLSWVTMLEFAIGAACLVLLLRELHEGGFAGRLHLLGQLFQYDFTDLAAAGPAAAADLLLTRTNGRQQRLSFEALHDGASHRDRLLAHIRQQLTT